MKQIDISTPKYPKTFTLVDDADFEWLNQWKWCIVTGRTGIKYVTRTKQKNNKKTWFYMHRLIMNAPKGMETDHINHDGLDNRRCNLRICTKSQNLWNSRPSGKASKHKGVAWHTPGNKWVAHIAVDGKKYYLGLYNTELGAAEAYKRAAEKHHGEFVSV